MNWFCSQDGCSAGLLADADGMTYVEAVPNRPWTQPIPIHKTSHQKADRTR